MKKLQISLENISKKYGNHTILKNININIYEGDFICIFGKSGEGKTTLLNILGTLEDYDSGKMMCFLKTDPVKNRKSCELLRREKIAYLFQNFALVEKMTVKENMQLATKYNKEKKNIESVLDEMGILNKLNSKVYELSGGEQQRVALARNMVKPFDIMLADEPTGSLDYENKKMVIETLVRINNEGKTVVVVSHDRDFEKIAHRSFNIEDGELKEINRYEK